MAYVAVKGGERAIDAAHALLARERRGDPAIPELRTDQVAAQLGRAVDRVMAEGGCHDRELAALAVKQAQGDLVEAAFLLRAFRTTLPRLADTLPIDTGRMATRRRISAVFKDVPGGQVLGPTYDYTHRLLDFALAAEGGAAEGGAPERDAPSGGRADGEGPPDAGEPARATPDASPGRDADGDGCAAANTRAETAPMPRVIDLLGAQGLIEPDGAAATTPPGDLTRTPLAHPAGRDLRLQALARGDEGFLLALGYSTQRGWGGTHPFVGELRVGEVAVEVELPELGFAVEIGTITVTECQMVNQFHGSRTVPPQFTRGYGLCFGHNERKAMGMALVDRALRASELGEDVRAPAQDAEFVLGHCDNIEATGFVEHLKLPHYVDFASELETVRRLRREAEAARAEAAASPGVAPDRPDGAPHGTAPEPTNATAGDMATTRAGGATATAPRGAPAPDAEAAR